MRNVCTYQKLPKLSTLKIPNCILNNIIIMISDGTCLQERECKNANTQHSTCIFRIECNVHGYGIAVEKTLKKWN